PPLAAPGQAGLRPAHDRGHQPLRDAPLAAGGLAGRAAASVHGRDGAARRMGAGDVIEDVYPLSSMQQGMLFNNLYSTEPGVDVVQLVIRLRERLASRGLARASQRVLARHTALRTGLRWDAGGEPVQEVHGGVELPV